MKAAITAGGRIAGAYAREAGTAVKALVRIRGITMLDRAIDALRGAGVSRIAVVGGEAVRAACAHRIDLMIDEGPTGAENLSRALRAWPGDEPLLYATSDMPYVDAASVAAFVERVPRDSLAVPLAEYEAFLQRFPGTPRCGITLAGERVVNGGVFHIPAGAAERIEHLARRCFETRKHPLAMARLAGPALLLRMLIGRLSVARIEARASRVLGLAATAVRRSAPELAFDADTEIEFRYARRQP